MKMRRAVMNWKILRFFYGKSLNRFCVKSSREKYHRHNMLFGREKNWWWLLLQFEEKVWAFTTKSMSNSTNCLLAHGKNEEKNEKIGCGGMEGKLNKHRKPASLWTASSSSFCVQTFSYNFHFTPSICVIFPQQISLFFFVFPLPDDDREQKKKVENEIKEN